MGMITKHIGDLRIESAADAKRYAHIEEVTGYLYIRADAQLPVLTSVGGYLDIGADAQLPVLTSVGGSLDIGADAQLPVLTSVGGYLYIRADAQLPVLTSVGGVDITMPPVWVCGLEYTVTILDLTMRIGCQEHSLSDWAGFDNRQIAEMDGQKAVRFWAENKTKLLDFASANGRTVAQEVAS
jgi:hypothetical protein